MENIITINHFNYNLHKTKTNKRSYKPNVVIPNGDKNAENINNCNKDLTFLLTKNLHDA